MSDIAMLSLVLGVLLAAAILAIVILLVKVVHLGRQVAEFPQREAALRTDARKRSRIVHLASISEQLAPLLPGFRYNPKDVQWIGGHGAVDAIVWDGLEAGGDVKIVFLDVKAGPHARMTDHQRRIREAIAWKRIVFDEYRPPETVPLINALPPELSDEEAELVPEDQAEKEPDQHAGTGEGVVPVAGDVPALIAREGNLADEPGS
jgi:Endonuclease related to archaeal Holliday junction resolvase